MFLHVAKHVKKVIAEWFTQVRFLTANMAKKINYKDKLDKVFSEFIRLRDSSNGVFKCISCGEVKTFDQSDCGHYINRIHMATRFDERNCNAQCRHCNRFMEGNIPKYRKGLIEKYGKEAVEDIERLQDTTRQIKEVEYKELISHYNSEIKKLNENK